MQTYVAEIDGRAIFAFRSIDVSCAQAWLDIHAVMRHTLSRVLSGGDSIWDGRAEIVARKATSAEQTVWSTLSDKLVDEDQIEEQDNITVWLIPTSEDKRPSRTN
jgi:hypothetical protein